MMPERSVVVREAARAISTGKILHVTAPAVEASRRGQRSLASVDATVGPFHGVGSDGWSIECYGSDAQRGPGHFFFTSPEAAVTAMLEQLGNRIAPLWNAVLRATRDEREEAAERRLALTMGEIRRRGVEHRFTCRSPWCRRCMPR